MNVSLERLLDHDLWANGLTQQHISSQERVPTRVLELMAHIASVHRLFLSRAGAGQEMPVWPDPTSIDIQAELLRARRDWQGLLDRIPGDQSIEYTNSDGEAWTSRLDDLATHVAVHGAYHRGQIATLLGQAGLKAPYTDYVEATRRGLI
ncbi:MAG: DinB family protein [Phycisphaerales bacterium]